MFKEAPKILFTGLTKAIGSPREIEKNLEDTKYFDQQVDLKIPHNETNELKEV